VPSSHATDRNLLFGILALQMDFVSRDQLIAGMHAWVLDKSKPLGQIFCDQGALPAEQRTLLDALVQEHLKKHGNDPQQSLAAVSSIRSARRDLVEIADAELQASLLHVAVKGADDPQATTSEATTPSRSRALRFHILRPHARGGLGEVFVARDDELHREVALKEIHERHADHAESRARFLLEAEVTGGLEHPGVVPVYGLGQYADGRPFYAMRFIKGDSLKDAIAAFHKEKASLPRGEHTLRLRQLLTRFLDVCNAVAYAHSRGVLHRDLKPGNVMLGKFGETLVVDWGLAKVLERADTETTEGLLRSNLSGDSAMTQTGAALGTPAYMSPEQAAGHLDQLGPASDVYSLGATLYCLLTGHAPFPSGDVGEVLARVQKGDYSRPRELDRQIHPALEAIGLKAMALRPEQRYASPQTLADDLEKWLADEPVSAYREPLLARLARWRRRHSTLVTVAGVLLLALVGAAVVGGFVVGREQERTRALAQVDALQDAAAANVPALLKELAAHRADVQPRLRAGWQVDTRTDAQRLRLGLALADDAEVRAKLVTLARTADDPQEVLLIRDALVPFAAEMSPLLWKPVSDPSTPAIERFRLLAILATLDPESADWPAQAGATVEQFLAANPLHLGTLKAALERVRRLLLPPLGEAFRAWRDSDRGRLVANILADYSADLPDNLVALLLDADERQYSVLLPKVKAQREAVLPLLHRELERTAAEAAPDAEKDALGERQANAAVTLLHLDDSERVWPLLRHSADPSRRTHLLHKLASHGIGAAAVMRRLESQPAPEVSERRALLLALGEYPPTVLAEEERQRLVGQLLRDYRDEADAGIHGAVAWLLRQWQHGKDVQASDEPLRGQPAGERQCYVNKQGQTLTIVPADREFLMGSPEQEPDRHFPEVQHRVRIPRSFAIGTQEITVAQFRRFLEATPGGMRQFYSKGIQETLKNYSPDDHGPMSMVSWYQAAAYCNWLSKEEGLEECYPALDKIKDGMQMREEFLQRSGYRLPTEAEWEYACRAGAGTSRFYGTSEKLLGRYAWFSKTTEEKQTRPGGLFKPNDLGLFDVYGNVGEWCQDGYAAPYERPAGDGARADGENGIRDIKDTQGRMLRGAAFDDHALSVRSASRFTYLPTNRDRSVGFRVARTYR
jgi:formylglycine-generating enzyme required for sulfatase activity/tRNA A-37 threonylcarbamoyl transferase component Bud32